MVPDKTVLHIAVDQSDTDSKSASVRVLIGNGRTETQQELENACSVNDNGEPPVENYYVIKYTKAPEPIGKRHISSVQPHKKKISRHERRGSYAF